MSLPRRTVAGSGRGSTTGLHGGQPARGRTSRVWPRPAIGPIDRARGDFDAAAATPRAPQNLEGIGIDTGKRITPCARTNSHAHCSARGGEAQQAHARRDQQGRDRQADRGTQQSGNDPLRAGIMASSVVSLSLVTFAGPPPAVP